MIYGERGGEGIIMLTELCILVKVLVLVGAAIAFQSWDRMENYNNVLFIQKKCNFQCAKLVFGKERVELECEQQCKINQCRRGCEAWDQAFDTSCQAVCNGTQELLPPKEFYCVLGCHDALNRHFQRLKAQIGTPPAPALIADSLTATSLSLEWKGVDIDKRAGDISYFVQWRYEDLAETWQYCRNQSWGEDDQILIENLQPYTKYRFRIALLLKSQHNSEPIVSVPSVVILTCPAGLPTSAPINVRAAANSYRVFVSWEPGPFSNGPLLTYVLRLQGAEHPQLKDIPAIENSNHYMFQNLKPNQNYSVSVTMRNGVGQGPPAIINISTTRESTVKDTQQPILILGGEHVVMMQDADMLNEPSVVYETENVIRGVAIHVASTQLFISTSMDYVYRTSIIERSEAKAILSPGQVMNFKPLSLSVDWLNLHLYVLGEVKHAMTEWQIARCNLDGKGLIVIMAGFLTRPSHIEVDPYNGYIFWVTKAGLFRLDLADISNGVKHEFQPYLILEDANLGAFTVDHMNFRLLVPHHTKNTVLSVTLDGREIFDLRSNTQKPKFNNVVSLAMANGLFYWINGEDVFTEDYHRAQNRYFHNSSLDRPDTSFVSVNILMNASQPVPAPVNPPTKVQAVLGAEKAKVSWQAPHLVGYQGKGAWQDWLYELEIINESTGETIHQKDIVELSHTVYNLREKSKYSIKAAAYTNTGRGPWSAEFHGRTLRDDSHAPILWSSNEGLLRSDVTGENIDILVSKTNLKESESEFHIVDVSWYKDVLYIVGNNSALYSYNVSNNQRTKLIMHSVGSIAVDWLSKKLYWANTKQQIIIRANLDGSQQEPMSILAIVNKLMIDSLEAYLYWSTGHTVEVVRLNGQNRRYYYSDEIFNNKQVMGLTLNIENRYVYWIVQSYESGSIVYRAPTSERIPMTHKIVPEKITALKDSNVQGPLCYFSSEHLLWLQDGTNAVIEDLSSQNTAVITLSGITLSSLHMMAVMDPVLHQYPKNLTADTIIVSPNAVDVNSIRVEGTWRNFNISWDSVKNVNYGTVFYEVKFVDYINTNSNPEVTIETTMPYNNSDQILPYSSLEVTIKAFTYWEAAHNTPKILRSPQSVPTQPTSPRAFVDREFRHELMNDSLVTFRWNQPQFTNGVIQGYMVQCWFIENQTKIQIYNDQSVSASTLTYTVHNLRRSTTYYFQVRAYTEIGAGPYTDLINVSTTYENPVPQLLVATEKDVRILDLDQKTNYTLSKDSATAVNYLEVENEIYWTTWLSSKELITSKINGTNATKILTLKNVAQSLCIDWVAKNLYWSEYWFGYEYRYNSIYTYNVSSYIMKLNLIMWKVGVIKYNNIIVRSERYIPVLDVVPSMGSLYWIEEMSDYKAIIMQSDLDGRNVQPFFKDINNSCTCPSSLFVMPTMTIDKTNIKKPMIYWVSMEGHLNVADIHGCMCNVILNAGFEVENFRSLTVDKINIYWYNVTERRIYFIRKEYPYLVNKENVSKAELKSFYLPNVNYIIAFGKSLQAYPTTKCLIPRRKDYTIEQVEITANSIVVKLPEMSPEIDCEKYSLPSTLYIIHVHCLKECKDFKVPPNQTYERRYEIQNLKPFTKYKLHLTLSNVYIQQFELSTEDFIWLSDERFTFQTLDDVPSAPGKPTLTRLRHLIYQLNWAHARTHGSQITLYQLEGLIIDDNYKQDNKVDENEHWNLYYNGTDNYWIITKDIDQKYIKFRVRAKNAYGFGAWNESSSIIDLTESTGGLINIITQQYLPLMVGLIVIVIIIMLACFYYFVCRVYRQRKKDKKIVLLPTIPEHEEIIPLQIPRRNFLNINPLYDSTLPNDSNDSALPKIKQDQIRLGKLLGSGAFGEVFQGNVKDLEGPGITHVAIKMLPEDASSQEKTEFLQEARRMSHLQHKHVLRLLGVCLDTDSPLLVLELMEAGDLLNYLRESRSLQPTDSHALRLQDLLAMCEDVARGCRYLEEVHFVHRDLACRNCLISAKDRENRVVKIGDFGLARNIYRKDYYRKKGKGRLPVRWMASESLEKGIFTSKSDVWAFGVLIWEITSLGQQPYPALEDNLEVMEYVRAGGRLPKPLNCPPTLHQLMMRCWSAADARPSFEICLKEIVELRSNIEDTILSPVHTGRHLTCRGNSKKSSSSEGSRNMQPFLQNLNYAMLNLQSGEVSNLELADNEEIILKENPRSGYEVELRSNYISNQNLANMNRIDCTNQDKCISLPTETTQEHSIGEQKQSDGMLFEKRSSIASLNLSDRKGASISRIPKKYNTLDSSKSVNSVAKTTLKREILSCP